MIAFVATLTDGRRTVVLSPSAGSALECLTTGTRIGGDLVEDFAISRLGLALCSVATLRRDVDTATQADGTRGAVTLEAAPAETIATAKLSSFPQIR